jgi:hypothetical protein
VNDSVGKHVGKKNVVVSPFQVEDLETQLRRSISKQLQTYGIQNYYLSLHITVASFLLFTLPILL